MTDRADPRIERIRAMRAEGRSVREISDALGIAHATMYRLFARHEIALPTLPAAHDPQVERIRAMLAEGCSVRAIARAFGVSSVAIYERMSRHGIATPSSSKTSSDADRIRGMLAEGCTDAAIGQALGIDARSVRHRMADLGIWRADFAPARVTAAAALEAAPEAEPEPDASDLPALVRRCGALLGAASATLARIAAHPALAAADVVAATPREPTPTESAATPPAVASPAPPAPPAAPDRETDDMAWNDALDGQLRELWAQDKLSCSAIAARMGLTRNAVIGRAHRLDLPGRTSPIVRTAPAWNDERDALLRSLWADASLTQAEIAARLGVTRTAAVNRTDRLGLPARSAVPVAAPMRAATAELSPAAPTMPPPPRPAPVPIEPRPRVSTCSYPIGEPGRRDFRFCDAPTDGRSSYCAEHAALCFTGQKAGTTASPRPPRVTDATRARWMEL